MPLNPLEEKSFLSKTYVDGAEKSSFQSLPTNTDFSDERKGLIGIKDTLSKVQRDEVKFDFKGNYLIPRLYILAEEIHQTELTYQNALFEDLRMDLSSLQRENIKAMQDHAIKVQNESVAQAFKRVTYYLSFATSLIFALTVPELPAIVYGSMLASGIVGLVNRVIQDTGIFEKIASFFVKRKVARDFAEKVDQTATYSSFACNLIGIIGGAPISLESLLKIDPNFFQKSFFTASTLISVGANANENMAISSVAKGEAELMAIDRRRDINQKEMKKNFDSTTSKNKTLNTLLDHAAYALKNFMQLSVKLFRRN